MRKKYFVSSIFLILILLIFSYFNFFQVKKVYEIVDKKEKIITKGLSMNLEQTAGAGDYKQVTQSNWPTKGYKFNKELSRCEKGSELSWDDTKKAVIMQGNVSDKCYVYFDKYSLSVVKSFSYTATKTSLTITATNTIIVN